jgi:aryl carrier-like protein
MIPASFRVIEALPLTLNGKVDGARLPSLDNADASAGNIASKLTGANFEDIIGAIWGKTLRRAEVGRNENFFDAGGDSLRLIAMHSALCQVLSISLTIDELFEHPTIASLAKWIGGERMVNPARESLRERVRKQHDALRRRRQAQAGS